MVQAALENVEGLFTIVNREEGPMYLVERVTAPSNRRLAMIYMRSDGLFEGHIYHQERPADPVDGSSDELSEGFEVCAVTETLPRARTIVYEELGL